MSKRKSEQLLGEIETLKKENSELKSLLQNQKKKSNKETQSPSQDITIFKQIIDISIKLDYLPYNEIFPFITSEIKSILGLKAAFINTYDEATSELVFQYSTLSEEENSKVVKLLGGKLLKRRTYVSDKEYKRITSKIYEKIPSLHELTFGAIPDIIGKPIEKLFGVDWFGALGLIHNEKLVGTIIFAGNNNQQFPERETVSAFAEKVAHALVRKEFEEKLTESEKRYQSIINSSPVGLHIYELQEDDKLVFIGANPAADKILGFDHKTIFGLSIEEAFPPLIETEVPARYREVIRNKTIWKTDQINYKDNKIIGAFEVFAYSISDNQLVVRFDDITLRLQREQIIKESEEYLSITLNSIGDGVISTDKIGRVTKMNPVAEKLCGWNFEQAKGKLLDEVFNIVDATTKQKLSNPVEKVIRTGEVVELSNHTVLISKDGTERNISDSAAPILDKENNIQGVVLVFTDVTEKYMAREAIKARERRFEQLIHNSFDTIVILDREGIQRYVSATAERVLGYSPEELNDIPVIDQMIHPDDKEQVLTAFRQIIETGQGGVQYRHRRKSGGWVHLEALGTNQLDNPDINGVVVNVRDITERKKIEIEIQVEKERISRILKLVGDPIFVKDDQHRFTLANKAFYEMVGLDEQNVIGKTLAEDIPLEEMNHFLAVDRLVLDTGIPDIREEELTINNTTKSIVTSKTRFTDDSGNRFLIGSIRDITERVNAEKEIAHFNDLMKFVIENTKSSVSVFDTEMNYIYVSDQYYDDMHLSDKNIIGLNHYDVFPYLPQSLRDIHKRSLNGETISGYEDPLVHSDGSKDWANWTCMPWYKADKSIGGVIIYIEVITERMKAAEALKESEDRFSRAIAGTGAGLWDWDMVNNKVFFSEQWKNMLGYQVHEVENDFSAWKNLWHPDDAALIENAVEDYLQMKTSVYEVVHRLKHKDGSWHWILTRGDIHRDSSGKPVRWIGTNIDITERKRAEEALQAERDQLFSVFNSIDEVIYISDTETYELLYVNSFIKKSLSMDVIGQKCYKVLQGLDAPCEFCTNDIILKQKPDPHHWEFYNKKYDRYYSLVDRIIRWPDGRDVRFEMAVDITERKKGEEQIELLAQMVAIAPGAIIIHDFEGQIFYANQRAAQMHGCTVEEFLALNLRDIDVPETADLIPARMEELINNGEINFEGRHKRVDGTAYPVQVYAKKIEWADKPAILSITTDITERKRAEEALRESESQFRSLFDNAADAIFIAEAESGKIVNANQTAVKLLSTSIENIIGKHQSELHPQEINNHSETSFQKHKIEIEEMNLANPIESVVLSSNGSEIPVEVLASKVLYQGKNCIMGIFRDITERKKTEKELRESEEQYRTLVENLNEAVMLVDLDDRIHFVNNKFTELLGYSQDEIIGKIGYEILIPPQDQLLIIDANTDRKKGLSGQYEVNFVKKNGDLCCFLVNGSPVHNAEGEVIGSLGALTDITESKKSKEELERTRIQLIETIMQSPLPMVLASAEDYKLKVINKATEDFLLINAKDYLEKPLMEIDVVWQEYTPDGLKVEPSELPLPRALQGMVTNSKEMKLERIDGSTVWQLASGAPIFDSQGKLIAGLLVLQDITDRKRAERVQEILYNIALHIHLEKSTKELLEFVRQEIGTVMDTSNFFAAVYNPEKDTLKSIIFVDEVDDFAEDEWPASQTISGHVVKAGKTVFLRGEEIDEFYSKHSIGLEGTIPKCWIGVPIFSHAKSIGIMVIQNYKNYSTFSNWDVTMLEMIAHEIGVFIEKHTMIEELVKAKEKAEEMNRVKSIFFANMSHELRTPFVGITGFAELLADSLKNSEEKYMAEGILKSSSRMQDTLSKILGLAKLESDSVEVLKRKVNVNELILDLFESFRGGALLKNITFENNIIFNELIIESDDFIIKDILQNLVSNAIKCTNHGGVKIIAEVKKKNDLDFLVIKVADTGVGIPKEKLDIIWEPFRQASEGFSRNFEGTGLGLSIVKRSSELLGGILNVESEEGKGSVFTISFPIKIISRSVDVGVQNVELVNPTATNKRILYVEDDELSREVVKRFLLKTCEIEIADNASEAIEKVKSQIYDAILMDINLKGSKNGVDLMQEIRKHSNYEKIPIIALTAYASQDDKVKFLSQGFTQYISKPFKKLALIELISSVFTE